MRAPLPSEYWAEARETRIDPKTEQVRALHDDIARCGSELPLA